MNEFLDALDTPFFNCLLVIIFMIMFAWPFFRAKYGEKKLRFGDRKNGQMYSLTVRQAANLVNSNGNKGEQRWWNMQGHQGIVMLPKYSFDSYDEWRTAQWLLCNQDRCNYLGITLSYDADDCNRLWTNE